MTSERNIESLFFEAADADSQQLLDEIITKISGLPDIVNGDVPEHISLLLEHWGDAIEDSVPRSLFCYRLCELSPVDTPLLRNALFKALKKTVPKDVSRNNAAVALGLKDAGVTPSQIALRFRRLLLLKAGLCFFSEKENKWGMLETIDPLTGELHVREEGGRKTYPVSTGKMLSEFIPFNADAGFAGRLRASAKGGAMDRGTWTSELLKNSPLPLTEAQIDRIAFATIVPEVMTLDEFNNWWKSAQSDKQENGGGKDVGSARNIRELHGILSNMLAKSMKIGQLTDAERKNIGECLSKLRNEPRIPEQKIFAETLSMLMSAGCPASEIATMISGNLRDRVPFWPAKTGDASREKLELWDEIAYEHIPNLLAITSSVFSREYLSSFLTRLPLRALNSASSEVLDYEMIGKLDKPSADIILHIWKNRGAATAKILSRITFRNIFSALSDADEISWSSSLKDLKKMLIENKDMQTYLLEHHSENEEEIFEALKINRALSQHEIQSILAKMSRISPEFKRFLEKNQGRGAVNLQKSDTGTDGSPIPVTSIKSYNRRIKEFEDIINKQIPENTAAIAHARGYGDLRENAEYSAAKERQRFLNRRKAELERDLANVIPFNFEKHENDHVRIGTTVDLDIQDSSKVVRETYHVVGLWDSEPERKMLSSDTLFSKALMSKRCGEAVELPDGKKATVVSIKPLPDEMIRELNNEHEHN